MRKAASYLFPALLVVSMVLHFWAMNRSVPELELAAVPSTAVVTTEILMVEEPLPTPAPTPEATPEPAPEPTPEPTSEPTPETDEKILTAEESDIPAPATPVPTPKPTPTATPTPKPTVKPSTPRTASASNIPVPVVIKNTPPAYPEIARQKGWEGRTIVRVEVSPEGRAAKVSIARSSGFGVLDQAALRAVKQWRFKPRTIAGIPAPGTVEVPVNFGLNR